MEANALIAQAADLLGESASWRSTRKVTALQADGSSRRFFRIQAADDPHASILAILPPLQASAKDMAEARSVACIGRHLQRYGAATPALHAWDAESGLVLCEDFGDIRLHGHALAASQQGHRLHLYKQSLQALARMQVRGAEGFDPAWCWDTPRYDAALMQERESAYFLRACCQDLLGLSFDAAQLGEECRYLALQAAQAPGDFFLHRDFQCRNIMLSEARPRFIDFQGGRLGPLGYDLASLLIDPYAALPPDMQNHLLNTYLEALDREISYDHGQFPHEYLLLSVQRNLQILGAFAFLSQVKGKIFFTQFLQPAAASLASLLAHREFARYAGLRTLSRQCCSQLDRVL